MRSGLRQDLLRLRWNLDVLGSESRNFRFEMTAILPPQLQTRYAVQRATELTARDYPKTCNLGMTMMPGPVYYRIVGH